MMMMLLVVLLCVRGEGVRVVNTVTFVTAVISRGGCDVVIRGGGRWRGSVGFHKHIPRLLNFSHSVFAQNISLLKIKDCHTQRHAFTDSSIGAHCN